MHRFMIAAMSLGLMSACAVERGDSADPPASSDGDQVPAAATSTTEQASTSSITPRFCVVPWDGSGAYYICDSTNQWVHGISTCLATCSGSCELGAICSGPCTCTIN